MAKIVKFNDGSLVKESNLKGYIGICVSEPKMALRNNIAQLDNRKCWLNVPEQLKDSIKEGADLAIVIGLPEAHLQIQEATTPFYEGQAPKVNPSTGEICMSGGKPIYRKVIATATPVADNILLIDVTPVKAATPEAVKVADLTDGLELRK